MEPDKPVIYCAGPMFSPEEKQAMLDIAGHLEAEGFATYVPHRDGLEVARIVRLLRAGRFAAFEGIFPGVMRLGHKAVFALDAFQVLVRCRGVVCNLNGRSPDEGGIVEASLAFASGRPAILYKHDARSLLFGDDNPLLSGLSPSFGTIDQLTELPRAMRAALLAAQPLLPGALPPHLQKICAFGSQIWDYRQNYPFEGGPEALLQAVSAFITLCNDSPALAALSWS